VLDGNGAAFELGVQLLAGHGVTIPSRLDERETVEDLARYLDNWFDAVVIRTPNFQTLGRFADAAHAPVINARTRHNHPCEILGDLAAIRHADVVYTDCWPSRADDEQDQRIRSLFLPCPPVTRGEEVSADAMQAAKCRVYEAKQWLLHAQNALLEQTLTEC